MILIAMFLGLAASWQHQSRWLLRRPGSRQQWRMLHIYRAMTATSEEASAKATGVAEAMRSFEDAKQIGEELRRDRSVRMRFAPSPTGSLHVGGARTALYNWLAARKAGGKFLIRIEDTDLARSTRESEDSMLADLEWLGLDWDEGPRVDGPAKPYRQSERGSIYSAAAELLVRSGHAYLCFCSEEELEAKRRAAQEAGLKVAYDGTWRDADPVEVKQRIDAGDPYTIRFKAPDGAVVGIDDKIRGRVEWDVGATIGDFIIVRSTGVPVYNFVVAVDDALMGVSTVVRAEEHLTNTVRQLLVLNALGFDAPSYAHASLILGSDRSKLSKRHGATSCGQFRQRGYLPDAIINYLALLGWSDGSDREVYTRDELVGAFDIDRVLPSPAMFDEAKLRWLNGQHLRAMPVCDLAELLAEYLATADVELPAQNSPEGVAFLQAATSMAQPKAALVVDIATLTANALQYPLLEALQGDDPKVISILDDGFADFASVLCASYDRREAPAYFYDDEERTEDSNVTLDSWISLLGEKTGRVKKRLFMSVRLALTGRASGPDVRQQLETLGAAKAAGVKVPNLALMPQRIDQLKQFASESASDASLASDDGVPVADHRVKQAAVPPLSFEDFKKLRQVYEAHRRTLCDDERAMYDVLISAYHASRRNT